MTLNLLKKGLQKLVNEGIDTEEAKQAIDDINEIQQRVGDHDVFNGKCYVLHADIIIDFMNMLTYDEYGKLYAKLNPMGHEVAFSHYEKACRDMFISNSIPLSVIQVGYEVISDLYRDNEADGCHNPDGTFDHNN